MSKTTGTKTEPCHHCGRAVEVGHPTTPTSYVHVIDAGEDRGWFPVGHACGRKLAKAGHEVDMW